MTMLILRVSLTFLSAAMSRVLSACSSPCRLVAVVQLVELRASSSSRSRIFCCCRSHSEPWVLTFCSTWVSLEWTCFSSAQSYKKMQRRMFRIVFLLVQLWISLSGISRRFTPEAKCSAPQNGKILILLIFKIKHFKRKYRMSEVLRSATLPRPVRTRPNTLVNATSLEHSINSHLLTLSPSTGGTAAMTTRALP